MDLKTNTKNEISGTICKLNDIAKRNLHSQSMFYEEKKIKKT